MRRWLAVASVFAVAWLAAWLLGREPSSDTRTDREPGARRPNVVLYVVDTLRADHLGTYGYDRATSPVLDRWAAESVLFERAYAPCSWTKPSMVSVMSGLDPVSHGVEDRLDVIPAHVRLLSERLYSAGYSTFGAVTNPNVLPQWGFDRGFVVYEDLDSTGHGTRADAVSDFVEANIERLARSQPFFLYLHVLDPHAPYEPPAPYDTAFPRSPAFPPNRSLGRYDGEVAFVDSEFGRILDLLSTHGLSDGTVMIFTADHGEELWDRGELGHGSSLFEEVVRVPLVIRFPGGRYAGTRVGARASLSDVVPTVMSTIGESPPADVDGRDLTELLQEARPEWVNRNLYLSLRTTGPEGRLLRGVVSASYKFLRRSRPDPSVSLYDIEHDPAETKDLATASVDLRRRLESTLDAYLARRSSGIHLRVVHGPKDEPVGCEVSLRTTGRFTDVSAARLEADDRFELSGDAQRLTLNCRLENRLQVLRAKERLVPDEDGVRFLVIPSDARIVVERLRLDDGSQIPLRAGTGAELEATPFIFEATDPALSVRDVGESLRDAGTAPEGRARAFLAVIRPTAETAELPQELLDRLRALGYVEAPARHRGAP